MSRSTAGKWLASALLASSSSSGGPREGRTAGFNPHPAGVMQSDGTSFLLLRIFVAHPTTWFTAGELMRRSKRSRQSVSWALAYLRTKQMVLDAEDSRRNPRYRRYRLAVDAPGAGSQPPAAVTPSTQPSAEQVALELRF